MGIKISIARCVVTGTVHQDGISFGTILWHVHQGEQFDPVPHGNLVFELIIVLLHETIDGGLRTGEDGRSKKDNQDQCFFHASYLG